MRRFWIMAGLIVTVVAATGSALYQRGRHGQEFHFVGTRLKVNLAQPDAVIRSASLSRLPHDLLKLPLARDLLTEELAFYYEQQEDRLGLAGAIKRIAYEHQLAWSDRILAAVFNEPAELAFWRDGKGALRHYALVLRRNLLTQVLQQAATVALPDPQLEAAGEIDDGNGGKAVLLALKLNPRRTLLLVSQGGRLVVLSDPGLLFDNGNAQVPVPEARAAVLDWLGHEGALWRRFAAGRSQSASAPASAPIHSVAIGAGTLALGYGTFLNGFKGLRFDFEQGWSSAVWLTAASQPPAAADAAELWRAAPANPSACVALPVDWGAVKQVVSRADKKPGLPDLSAFDALASSALACWYNESALYSPVFMARLTRDLPQRNAALQALADWAIAGGSAARLPATAKSQTPDPVLRWSGNGGAATLAAHGRFVVFSPDPALVNKVLDTLARKHPSVADQTPASAATLALLTPAPLAAMAEREMLRALSGAGDADLLALARTHLPARLAALATYPAYRLELSNQRQAQSDWRALQWHATGPAP